MKTSKNGDNHSSPENHAIIVVSDHTQSSHDDIEILLEPAKTALPQNERANVFVRKTIKSLGYASFALELGYVKFTYHYVKQSIEIIGELANINTTNAAIAPALLLTALDASANLTFFNPEAESIKWSQQLPDGFYIGMRDYFKNMFSTPNTFFTIGLPTFSMIISYPICSYTTIEPLVGDFKDAIGNFTWIPIGITCTLGSTYFLSQARDTLAGIDFFLSRGNARLNPLQKSLLHYFRYGDWNTRASVFQCLLELSSALINRSLGIAFVAGRIAEQADSPLATIYVCQVTGFISSLITFGPARSPTSYRKYFGDNENRLDLVLKEERDQVYAQQYGMMGWKAFLLKEGMRILSPLGLSETVLSGYFGSYLSNLLPDIHALTGWPADYAIPALLGVIVGGFVYTMIYRKADLMRELNTLALHQPEVRDRINQQTGNIPTHSSQPHQDPSTSPNPPISTFSSRLGTLFALGSWTSRTLISIPSTAAVAGNHTNLSKIDQTIFSITSNTIVADNGYRYFKKNIASTLENWKHLVSTHFSQSQQEKEMTLLSSSVSQAKATLFSPKASPKKLSQDNTPRNKRGCGVM